MQVRKQNPQQVSCVTEFLTSNGESIANHTCLNSFATIDLRESIPNGGLPAKSARVAVHDGFTSMWLFRDSQTCPSEHPQTLFSL